MGSNSELRAGIKQEMDGPGIIVIDGKEGLDEKC